MASPHRWLDEPEHGLRCSRCDCPFNSECGQGECPAFLETGGSGGQTYVNENALRAWQQDEEE